MIANEIANDKSFDPVNGIVNGIAKCKVNGIANGVAICSARYSLYYCLSTIPLPIPLTFPKV